jgi:aminopeptidase N
MYGRAPLFLQALADLMGQERFGAFLAELARRFRWRMVDGEAFRALAEELGACSRGQLEDLWAHWVRPQAIEPEKSTD